MERITSRQNAIVRRFRELARAPFQPQSAEILLDGEHLLEEALACGLAIDVAAFSTATAALADAVERQRGRTINVTDDVLAAMSPVQHPSGVVAIARARPADVAATFASDATHPSLTVVLAGLQDPGNVGAVVRSAAACGATGVVVIDGTASPFGWKALRGSMGGAFRLPVVPRATVAETIAAAREAGVRLVAAVPRGGTPLPSFDFTQPTALLLGGEGGGVGAAVMAAADATVTIPMRAPVESLNVATAAAILLYEATRQRSTIAR